MPRTVMIIDDERDANNLMAGLLEARGYQTIQVLSGKEAIEAVHRHKPDLILLDLMLPDVDGFAICTQLKYHRDTNLIPIVMVTALNDFNHRTEGIRVGANGYLTKPFEPSVLYETIERALQWRDEHTDRGTQGEILFDIRSEAKHLMQTNDMLADLYAHTDLTEKQVKDLRQAVMEMGNNAIEWGHRKNADLPLLITYRIDSNSVTLIIRDQGPGFNPSNLPHAAHEDDPIEHIDIRNELGIREGGFGIMLAKGLVDEFRYNEAGNEVTLVKHFQKKS